MFPNKSSGSEGIGPTQGSLPFLHSRWSPFPPSEHQLWLDTIGKSYPDTTLAWGTFQTTGASCWHDFQKATSGQQSPVKSLSNLGNHYSPTSIPDMSFKSQAAEQKTSKMIWGRLIDSMGYRKRMALGSSVLIIITFATSTGSTATHCPSTCTPQAPIGLTSWWSVVFLCGAVCDHQREREEVSAADV